MYTHGNKLKGRRVLGQLRCSLKEKAKKSLLQQHEWLSAYTQENQATYVGDMEEAISASQTKRRPDLDRIFERKRTLNDFDTILVQDLSRLTRGGVKHGLKLLFKFQDEGIALASVTDGLIESEDELISAARRFQEARATSKNNALGHARGRIASRRAGRVAYCLTTPFAVDKLIVGSDETARFILRSERDGTQSMLTPDGATLLKTYPKNEGHQRMHHAKQHDEFVRLIAGAPDAVRIVRQIHRWHFVDGYGLWWIARKLNDDGVLSALGRMWCTASVKNILVNPIYIGIGPAGRSSKAIFWEFGPNTPIPREEYEGPMAQYRSKDKWVYDPHPAFANFLELDAATTERIARWKQAVAERRAERRVVRPEGDKHVQSTFVFKKLLRLKQGSVAFVGHSSVSKTGKTLRYYKLSTAHNSPRSGDLAKVYLNADVLEGAVLPAIKEVVLSYGGVEAATIQAVRHYNDSHRPHDMANAASLVKKREKVLEKIAYWVGMLDVLGKAKVDERVLPLRNEAATLESSIRASDQQRKAEVPASTLLSNTERLIRDIASRWDRMPPETMRAVLRIMVKSMEFDAQTRQIDVELHLPSWMIEKSHALQECLKENAAKSVVFETSALWSILRRKLSFSHSIRGRRTTEYRLVESTGPTPVPKTWPAPSR